MAKNVKINGVTYQNVPEVDIPLATGSGTAKFHDTTGATAEAADVLSGETAFGANGAITGSMPNNGGTGGTITTKGGTVTIPAGYTTGGTVNLGNVTDLTAQNLLSGKTVLGVAGTLTLPTISQDATTKVLSIS
jgi:hypothetical protein